MIIYVGADHQGFKLKEFIKRFLLDSGYEVGDVGSAVYEEGDDYPDYARLVGEKVSQDYERSRGVLICGSGVGVSIVANKFPNVRAGLIASSDQAFDARNDDDMNVLCLAANYLEPDGARKIVSTWLQTPFANEERFRRRVQKISAVEFDIMKAQQDRAHEEDEQLKRLEGRE